ncbi:uncharacterized protein LOC135493786 [Lineus longissimus]|uniref:uncharacterized protein LOC135493786 n=1 Tax=Lineus longissimus TaxID=88925 RepID=UPI002B4DC526
MHYEMKSSAILLLLVLFTLGHTSDTGNTVEMIKYFCPSTQAIVTSLKGEVSSAVVNLDVKVGELKDEAEATAMTIVSLKDIVKDLIAQVDQLTKASADVSKNFVHSFGDCPNTYTDFNIDHQTYISLADCGFKCSAMSRCRSFQWRKNECWLKSKNCLDHELLYTDNPAYNQFRKAT